MSQGAPPGWYDDGQGRRRWFDGAGWTDHELPPEPTDATGEAAPDDLAADAWPDEPTGRSARRSASRAAPAPRGRRLWILLAAVVAVALVAAGVVALVGRGGDSGPPVATPTTPVLTVPTQPSVAGTSPVPSATGTAPTGSATSSATSSARPSASPSSTALADGPWTVAAYQFRNDGIGDFGGTARITYRGADPAGGVGNFTFTVIKGGKQVATLVGSVLDARPGQTTTVDLISTDPFVKGPYSAVRFRVDS